MKLSEIAQALDQPDDPRIREAIRQEVLGADASIVVLDDDPTGNQTVHNVPVLTTWDSKALEKELARQTPLFFILTNSRSMTAPEAEKLNFEIGARLQVAARNTHRRFRLISRSDSTLRGHYPLEPVTLKKACFDTEVPEVLVPAFPEGGRYTTGNVHYVREQDQLIPVGETPFAADKVFGFSSSNLLRWVMEKYQGQIGEEEISSISRELILEKPVSFLTDHLMQLRARVVVVNALSYRELEKLALAFHRAEGLGKTFLYRTAASFVRAYAGLEERPLLRREDFGRSAVGGLILVGSHVPKTTRQLEHLVRLEDLLSMELNVDELLAGGWDRIEPEIIRPMNEALAAGKDVLIYTSREQVSGKTDAEHIAIGQKVSSALVSMVRALGVRPRYVLAKGGITASDLATRALEVKRALVLGQVYPGIPVWRLGPETPFEGLPFIVFPGNVGQDDTLLQMVEKWRL